MKWLILFILLISCNQLNKENKLIINNYNTENLTFNEFKKYLDLYAKEKPYPKLNEK